MESFKKFHEKFIIGGDLNDYTRRNHGEYIGGMHESIGYRERN